MEVSEFSQLAEEFDARVQRVAWCTVATVAPDTRHGPASCIRSESSSKPRLVWRRQP